MVLEATEFRQGTNEVLAATEQEFNSLVSTAMARILRLSLGSLNPEVLLYLWLGKRWVKSEFQNQFRNIIYHA